MEIEISRIDNTTLQDQMATQRRIAKRWAGAEEIEREANNKPKKINKKLEARRI